MPSFRRNLRRLMMPVAMCSVALMAASCSKATDDDSTALPEGKYPLELTVAELDAVATATLSTCNGTWEGGEEISVQIVRRENDGELYVSVDTVSTLRYTVSTDGKLSLKDSKEQLYWTDSKEVMYIRGWCAGNKESEAFSPGNDEPGKQRNWQVLPTQDRYENFVQSDFLLGYVTMHFRDRNREMEFKHQVAKVVVNLEESEYLKTHADKDISVTLKKGDANHTLYLEGKFKDGWYTELEKADPKAPFPSEHITFHRSEENSPYKYEALLIPQNLAGLYLEIKVGSTTYGWTVQAEGSTDPENIVAKANYACTFNITVDAKGLDVSVENINWTTGASGSGSVTLPETIDLSTKQEPINISDDKAYLILGKGTQTLTISEGSPKIYLANASITVSNGNAISITGGSPTIHVQGDNNTVSSGNDTDLAVSGGASVTIIGNSTTDVLTANGGETEVSGNYGVFSTAGAGIGSPVSGTLGGNITIRNVTVKATGGTLKDAGGGAGIGSSSNGPCGDITIENSIITANGGLFSAGIGMGCNYNYESPSIGNISITDSNVTATGGAEASAIGFPFSSLIGDSGTYKAGKITIKTDDEDLFLSKLTPGENKVPDVFATAQRVGKGTYLQLAIPILRNTADTDSWEGVTINKVEYKEGVK